jgi:biopolymer transport protein ExbB
MGQGNVARLFLTALVLGFMGLLTLAPAPAHASWWNGDWTARKAITIDTSATGAGITDPIGTTPVLIRLDVSDFTFDAANPDGSDIRFVAGDDKTPLAYHIEKYDHLLGQAFIWVNVPNLAPGAQTPIYLYYGNPKATAGDNVPGTYDSSMVAVYHFGEQNAPPKDSTSNANNALTPGQADNFALIGPGERLDGQHPIQLPGSPSLAWTAGQAMTWSIWFTETALQPDAVLYSRTDGTNTVQIGVDNGLPFVALITPTGTQRSSTGAAISAASWHSLTVVASASSITLYVDGVAYGTLAAGLPALNAVAYLGGDATTGTVPAVTPATPAPAAPTASPASPTPPAAPPVAATTGFIGSIDELEISNIARPVGFIKFAAIGQGNNPLAGKLLSYAPEEKPSSFFSGTFFVILSSVTIDGWVVIGILIIMAIVSWIVMADKIAYVGRTFKANDDFLEYYHQKTDDLTALPEQNGKRSAVDGSPLFNIYKISAFEIAKRIAKEHGDRHLSAQSIAAIRSSLDGAMVRQTQKLNRSMVLLTIAIAGGPFIGLLGTVMGVMITFASIAASGNVNINAIAPGISAALVATVAGLVVAIPSLFGYNYLNSRISNGIADMQVFVDELETRMAEVYSPATVAMPQH